MTTGHPAGVAGPWDPQFHPATVAVVVAAVAFYLAMARGDARPTSKQRLAFGVGMLSVLVVGSWPLEDLATHWSLTALVVQRLLLVLLAAPMLLASLPAALAARLTRPRAIDSVLAFVSKPVAAVVIFTAIAVGTLLTPAVAAQSSLSHSEGCDRRIAFVVWIRAVVAGHDKSSRRQPTVASRPGGLPLRTVSDSRLPVGRVHFRPPSALSGVLPRPQGART